MTDTNNKGYAPSDVLTNPELPIERGITNNQLYFQETDDFGSILRVLRENQGYSIRKLSKKISMSPEKISRIERSMQDVPNDAALRLWLKVLGCQDNLRKLMLIAAQHRVVHSLRLYTKDKSNADIVRLLDAYRRQTLSDLDRALLSLISRDPHDISRPPEYSNE